MSSFVAKKHDIERCDQRPATADLPYRQTASRVRCIAWFSMDAQTDAILAESREWLRTRCGTMESESLIAGLIAEVVRLANANERQSLSEEELKAIGLAAMEYEVRSEKGVGLQFSGPKECGELAATLRILLSRFD